MLKTSTLLKLGMSSILLFIQPFDRIAIAHNLEVKGNIAITFHIEPNHNPKVGKTAQTWFLLTRTGGAVIPLSQCECRLSLFLLKPKAVKLSNPALKAIAAEKYKGIPGAEIVFPQAGLYQLKLEGKSKAKPNSEQDFQPFSVIYKVTATD
jgi:hypothetical protein